MSGTKTMRCLVIVALIAMAFVPVKAWGQATLLPNGKSCYQAVTGLTGMVGTLGSITGGASYTTGTYGGVALTGGTGSGATANITVSGGGVTAVAILAPGTQYTVGDVLSASSASIGGTGGGFSVPILSVSINSSLAGGTVGYYIPNTLTFKTTWRNAAQTVVNSNPVPLDQNGCAVIYGLGSYRQIVKDSLGNTVWDAVTASTATSVPTPATSGSGDFLALGTIIPIAGFTAPTNYVLAYGQSLSRTTYSDALTAITISSSATCSSGSASVTGISSTAQMRVGAPIESACLPNSTTIATIAGPTSITTNNNATVSGTNTIRVFPWGNGDGSTTFNVPDLRGRVLPGPDAMGGVAANRLTDTYFGTTFSATAGVSAGPPASAGGFQNKAIVQGNLPSVNFTVSGITLTNPAPAAMTSTSLGAFKAKAIATGVGDVIMGIGGAGSDFTIQQNTQATAVATQGTAASGGSGASFAVVQPSLTMNYAIKVLNGVLPSVGILSLGGMTGDILCGVGLLCSSQTISEDRTAGAATLLMNSTNSIGSATFQTIPALVNSVTPDPSNDYLIVYDSATGTLKKVTVGTVGAIGVAGVSSFNGRVGAVAPIAGDYTASLVNYTPPGTGASTRTAAQKFNDMVNIRDYGAGGAVCDGVVNDTPTFNRAIAYLVTQSGGQIYVPGDALCHLATVVTVPDRISITGANQGRSNIYLTTSACDGFSVVGGNVLIENLQFIPLTPCASGAFISLLAGGGIFRNLIMTGPYVAIRITSSAFWTIEDVNATGVVNRGISCTGASDLGVINRVIMSGVTVISSDSGYWTDLCSDIQIHHSQFLTFNKGLAFVACSPNCDISSNIVTNVVLDQNQTGVLISTGAASTSSASRNYFNNVTASTSTGNGWSISTTGSGEIHGVFATNLIAIDNANNGVNVTGAVIDFQSTGGLVAGNALNGYYFGPNVSSFSVVNARVGNGGSWSGNAAFGIQVDAGASNNYAISLNNVRGNSSAGISDGGSGTNKISACISGGGTNIC